jgi:hypothetical protein
MESGSSSDASDVAPIIVELDPVVAELGTARRLVIPSRSGLESRVVTVQIPPGVKDGTLLRVPGAGEPGPPGAPPGDLSVRIRVTPFVPGVAPDSWATTASGAPAAPAGSAGPAAAARPGAPRRRPSRRNTILLVVLAAVGAVVAATTIMRGAGDNPAPAASGAALTPTVGSSTAAPTPTGMSPSSYQKALTAFDTQLARQVQALGRARTPTAAGRRISAMLVALYKAKASLESLDPPVGAQSAHDALLNAVEVLAGDLASAETAAASRKVCTGSTAAALISRTDGAHRMRLASTKIANLDRSHRYQVGSFLPRGKPDPNRRLANGTQLRHSTDGLGELKIINGYRADTVVSLVRGSAHKPVLAVYVRGGARTTVYGIGDGGYHVFLTSGQDWDPKLRVFTRNCAYERLDDTFTYTTTRTATGTRYDVGELKLNVHGGNVTSSDFDPDAFPPN